MVVDATVRAASKVLPGLREGLSPLHWFRVEFISSTSPVSQARQPTPALRCPWPTRSEHSHRSTGTRVGHASAKGLPTRGVEAAACAPTGS